MAVAEQHLDVTTATEPRSDRELVTAAQGGDQGAVAALVKRHYPRVLSFLTYQTGRDDAEDLTQEAFTRALRTLHRFNGRYRVGPWLIRIARNLCIDESRKASSDTHPVDLETLEDLDPRAASDSVWERVSSQIDSEVVKWALSQLSDRHRAALILREMEGLSYADIAQVLGTNPRGVEGTLRRARTKFRLVMADAEGLQGRKAVCRRVIRQVASTPDDARLPLDLKNHLSKCDECERRARRAVPAQTALGLLPPVTAVIPDLSIETATAAVNGGKGIIGVLREAANSFASSSVAGMAQTVASLGVAAALAAAPVMATELAAHSSTPEPVFTPGHYSDLAGAVTRGISTDTMAAPILQASSGGSPAAATSEEAAQRSQEGSSLTAGVTSVVSVEVSVDLDDLSLEGEVTTGFEFGGDTISSDPLDVETESGALLDEQPLEEPALPLAPSGLATSPSSVALPRRRS